MFPRGKGEGRLKSYPAVSAAFAERGHIFLICTKLSEGLVVELV